VTVGFGGWQDFKFLFAGRNAAGEDRIYAVNQDGELLCYGDLPAPENPAASRLSRRQNARRFREGHSKQLSASLV
jgi:hypothetical protein